MAKRAKKQTEAERATIDAERIAAAEKTGAYAEGENVVEFVPDPVLGALPEGVSMIEMTPDNIGDVHKMIADAVGEGEPEAEGDDEEPKEEGEVKEPISIVKDKFKQKYIENAIAVGATSKVAKRSNWDWLSQQLAAFCLNEKGKIDIGSFMDVLEANGVDHSKWVNRTKGWEGRFRMTGRVALQKVVANSGILQWPNGEPTEAPAEWRSKYQTKA